MKGIVRFIGYLLVSMGFSIVLYFVMASGKSTLLSVGITIGISFLIMMGWSLYDKGEL